MTAARRLAAASAGGCNPQRPQHTVPCPNIPSTTEHTGQECHRRPAPHPVPRTKQKNKSKRRSIPCPDMVHGCGGMVCVVWAVVSLAPCSGELSPFCGLEILCMSCAWGPVLPMAARVTPLWKWCHPQTALLLNCPAWLVCTAPRLSVTGHASRTLRSAATDRSGMYHGEQALCTRTLCGDHCVGGRLLHRRMSRRLSPRALVSGSCAL